jgi:hypothetical protein
LGFDRTFECLTGLGYLKNGRSDS